ncbi:MAG TPA: 16S rRNA (cytosine(1402)-N(4))-methyltransferase RsmH [Xanthomonadaceae bacterium]|nr:16S rRNA (cytosine(1402)-N(4))-methyltransferase RsmH [Xanthomonadaceae bacterium]
MNTTTHRPVMLAEAVTALAIRADGVYLDGTFGRGGHARAILDRLGPAGGLLLMDKDPEAVVWAREGFGGDPRVRIRQGSFADMAVWDDTAQGLDGILLDLGVSSPQLDCAERGFSFMVDGPLDMRMDPAQGESVAAWLARAEEGEIARVLWEYGEERMSRKIARAIVEQRRTAPLTRTAALATLIERCIGRREAGKHPATRSFQALRIFINRELEDLDHGLDAAVSRLKPGGRLVVISFHSLEDRRVKQFMHKRGGHAATPRRGRPEPAQAPAELRTLSRAIKPGAAEIEANPRARSAVLRVAERLP